MLIQVILMNAVVTKYRPLFYKMKASDDVRETCLKQA